MIPRTRDQILSGSFFFTTADGALLIPEIGGGSWFDWVWKMENEDNGFQSGISGAQARSSWPSFPDRSISATCASENGPSCWPFLWIVIFIGG
jgi:hypothetical protein